MPKHKHKKSSKQRGEGLDVELPPTSGALGNEKPKKRSRREKEQARVDKTAEDRQPLQNAPKAANVLPAHSEAPLPSLKNLAGAPELAIRGWRGARSVTQEVCKPWVNVNLNSESNIHFLLNTGAYEWVHLNRNAVSVVLYTTRQQAANDWGANEPERFPNDHQRAGELNQRHFQFVSTTRAQPNLALDPDIGARGLFHRVEVIINDQLVPTNGALGALFVHYARIMAIFKDENPKHRLPHFKLLTDFNYANAGEPNHVMHAATDPFAHRAWDDREGRRVCVPLDGIFPFDLKSTIHQTIEQMLPPVLFIPPSTKFELKLYFWPTRMETLFHNEVTSDNYFTIAANDANNWNLVTLRQTIQSCVMQYLSVEMFPAVHTDTMTKYRAKGEGTWNFDIPRGQHQALTANVSYTENTFQIYAYCRSIVIAFVPDHAAFVQAHLKRPLSMWSSFPENCTKIQIEYAGVSLGGPYINFGVRGTHSETSKDQYYENLRSLGLAGNITFNDIFPQDDTARSLVQFFVFDVRHLMLDRFQSLRIAMEFTRNANASPAGQQILVFSIHPNGEASVVNTSSTGVSWLWQFFQTN